MTNNNHRFALFVVVIVLLGVFLVLSGITASQQPQSRSLVASSITSVVEPTDNIYLVPASTATAIFWANSTAGSYIKTYQPPFPPSDTPSVAQILRSATLYVEYNTQVAEFATLYIQTPEGLRTPSTLQVNFALTIDLTFLTGTPTFTVESTAVEK